MKPVKLELTLYEAAHAGELCAADAALLQAAAGAARQAYAPYSHFRVGAAVLLANGETVCGNNQENAAYPSGLCAERVALFYANARFPDTPVCAIAITALPDHAHSPCPAYPCGACRQVLLECERRHGHPLRVIMGGAGKITIARSCRDLLPLSFDGENHGHE